MANEFYITTPIYYATDAPHIGHAYCTVVADAVARYRRLVGHDVFFLTGTDEHGQKMERQAAALGILPRELADRTSPRYLELWRKLGISNDGFIRTTEERHHRAVEEIWRRMVAAGDIYEGEYEGPYCVQCETFYNESDLVDGKCPDHGIVPERVREKGQFFRLSAYQQRLLDLYDSTPDFIHPARARNEVASFVRSGLRDLSISRGTTDWGWPVPGAAGQVIYVWVDALTNYLSGVGWPEPGSGFEDRWPADVHLVGKDILRFHAVYWPAFLMSAGVALPKQIYGHGWWLDRGRKIAKSGGTIRVEPLLETFGADAFRYFVLRETPLGNDGSYTDLAFVQRYNADLANDLGNLVQRTLRLVARYAGGVVPDPGDGVPAELPAVAADAVGRYRTELDAMRIARGLEAAWELVRAGNRLIDGRAPWALAKDPARRAELDWVLYASAELVRLALTCLWPVTPATSERGRASLGLEPVPSSAAELVWGVLPAGTEIAEFAPLYPRVDEKEWLARGVDGAGKEDVDNQPTPKTGEAETAAGATEATAGAETAADDRAGTGLITIDQFLHADLRVARVLSAEKIEKSRKLMRLMVDAGEDQPRQVVAGIAGKYAGEDLVGQNLIVVANLEPAKLMGVESRGMLLAASIDGLPVVATFDEDVPPGTRVR